jgi:hypothetical protein
MTMIRRLYDGNLNTGLTVRPDADWPSMWHIHYPDGSVSDMVNISRATDAALTWLRRTTGQHTANFKWKCAVSATAARPREKQHPARAPA